MTDGRQPGPFDVEAGPGPADHGADFEAGGRSDAAYGGTRHRRPRRRSHTVLKVVAAVVALIVILAGAGVFWADRQINPSGHRGAEVAVVIPPGSSKSRIGKILSRAGVIHDPSFFGVTLFAAYADTTGSGTLYPGTYVLAKNSSYGSVISALEAGPKIIEDKLLVPEGFTVRDIAASVAALPGLHLSAQKFIAAATNGIVTSPYEPAGVHNLEGLLFPATYLVKQGESEVDILEQMVGAFNDQARAVGLTAAAARMHRSVYQLVTVASIVEREAKLDRDRGPVASAIYNRLRVGMPLGADSTETYYLRLTDPKLIPSASQLDQPGRYNTRLNKGLPPTPISNPGLPSLEAAASPPDTTYLYFVEINPDGQLGFASTSDGFAQLQAQCRAANLC